MDRIEDNGVVIDPTPEHHEAVPTKDIQLANGAVGIGRGAKPFARNAELITPKGELRQADIYAVFRAPDEPSTVLLARRPEDGAGFLCRLSSKGVIEDLDPLGDNGYASVFFGDPQPHHLRPSVAVLVSRDRQDPYGLLVTTIKPGKTKEPLTMQTEANTLIIDKPKSHSETVQRKEKWRTRIKRTLGAAVTALALMPGGGVEHALDPFVKTGPTIEAIAEEQMLQPYTKESKLDGIEIYEYPDPEVVLAKANERVNTNNEQVAAVAAALEQTMADLDVHNYQAIRDRAEAYRASNPENVMTPEQVADIQASIERSNSREEALQAVQPFLEYSGKTMSVSDYHGEVSLPDIKKALQALVGEIGRYPKSLIEQADLDTFRLTNHTPGDGSVLASYSDYDKEITINADKVFLIQTMNKMSGTIPAIDYITGSGLDAESVVGHEFGHALSMLTSDTYPSHGLVVDTLTGVASNLVNYPVSASLYANTNAREQDAELFSGALGTRRDGMSHPDAALNFLSPANKAMLGVYFQIAKDDPGMIYWLTLTNPRLMDRSSIDVGR